MATQIVGRDQFGRNIPPGWGSLTYTNAGGTRRIFRFYIETIEQSQNLAGSSQQAKMYQHFYARSYAPAPVHVTGRVRDQPMYDDLGEFIRAHQKLLITTAGRNNVFDNERLPMMRLNIPSENLAYNGWVNAFEGGAKRFNVAPQFDFDFEVISDKHSTNNKITPSAALRSTWSGAFLSGAVADTTPAVTHNLTPAQKHTAAIIEASGLDNADAQLTRVLKGRLG
jgi:hypothetical protein